MQQPEKAYTPPPGNAPHQVPGQQYPAPQPQYPPGQYAQGPTQHPAQPQGQYPAQPPPQAVPAAYPAPAQHQPQQQPYTQQQQPYPAQSSGPTIIAQQPLPVVGMTIPAPGGNRNVLNFPCDALGRRRWSFGLFDCFDAFDPCVLGCFCPCILYAQLKRRVDYLNIYVRPDPIQGGTGIDPNCMVWCGVHLLTGCGFVLQAANRSHIRNRYMISGTGVEDFFTAWLCTPCQLTQEYRELELEERALTAGYQT